MTAELGKGAGRPASSARAGHRAGNLPLVMTVSLGRDITSMSIFYQCVLTERPVQGESSLWKPLRTDLEPFLYHSSSQGLARACCAHRAPTHHPGMRWSSDWQRRGAVISKVWWWLWTGMLTRCWEYEKYTVTAGGGGDGKSLSGAGTSGTRDVTEEAEEVSLRGIIDQC